MSIREITCPICKGHCSCQKCDGKGYYWGAVAKYPCKVCDESGKCPRCKGLGTIPA